MTPQSDEAAADAPESDEPKPEADKTESDEPETLGKVIYPFTASGNEQPPTQETILITSATFGPMNPTASFEDTDVLVENGKIKKIGKGLKAGGGKTIDGTGKHLTAGIIDEHSHIALSSVNDVATNSGMVRMGDVVDSEDINIYRQLAGGVTAAQLLHGSANPVGGQSALIKMRWGSSPEECRSKAPIPSSNSRWVRTSKDRRSQNSIRYPQTRMGVEQVYRTRLPTPWPTKNK